MFRSTVTALSLLFVQDILSAAASTTSTSTSTSHSSVRGLQGLETRPPITAGVQEGLDAAIALWESHEVTKYTMGFQRNCFCEEQYRQPTLVTVIEDDVITSVRNRETLEPLTENFLFENAYTVERLFERIQSALDRSAYEIRVEYDATYGYILDLVIDYDAQIADEELRVAVDFLEPTSVLVEEVVAKIDQWTALQVEHYSYTFQQFCSGEQECSDEMIQPKQVQVLNGAIFSIDGAFLAISRQVDSTIPAGLVTVSELLAYIQSSLVDDDGSGSAAFSVQVEYDDVYGFPSNVKIDFDENDPSDQVEVSLSGFTQLTDQEVQDLLAQVLIPETSPPKETEPPQENSQEASLGTQKPEGGEGIAPVSGGTPSVDLAKESAAAPILSKRALVMGLVLFGGAIMLY